MRAWRRGEAAEECGGAAFSAPSATLRACSPSRTLQKPDMMKLWMLVAVVALAAAAEKGEQRPRVSDEALEHALNDKRYLARQLKCALGEAPCDPIGRRLKTLAPLVLRGSCPQCTPQEMRQIQRTLSHIQRNYPKEWRKIVNQYASP